MPTHKLAVIVLTCMLLLATSLVSAFYQYYAPPQANFKHTPDLQGDDTPPGLPLAGKPICAVRPSSPRSMAIARTDELERLGEALRGVSAARWREGRAEQRAR
jgi:hypothetical protein